MAERSFGLPVLTIGGLLAIVAALFRVPASTPSQPEKQNEPPPTIAKDMRRAYQTGNDLLVAHLGHSPGTGEDDTLGILIATLPDPVDSHEDWMYDAHLEAIRRGFETSTFFLDRFWLPWPSDTSTVLPAESTRRVPTREGMPGVMLFRKRHHLRLLYVVGELPTEGVRRWALRRALDERDSILHEWQGPGEAWDRQVRIIGPTFSGSANSAQEVVEAWLQRHDSNTAVLVSGMATSLRRDCRLDPLHMTVTGTKSYTFCTTVNSDSLSTAAAKKVLDSLGIDSTEVAVLRETSSGYGTGFDSRINCYRGGADSQELPADSLKREADSLKREACLAKAAGTGWFNIPVPMSIATLRGAYEQNPGPQQPVARQPGRAQPRLPLTLQEPTRSQEAPAIISRLSAPYNDLVLEQILRTLQRRRVQAVGLMFTDVRDKLFLGELVKRRMPDVQLFTYGGHLLYARADRRDWLNGMLVFSTYPLVLDNQWWLKPDRAQSRMAFPTDGAEGTYNATLLLLERRDQMLDYGGPSDTSNLPGRPPVSRRPPVWVSVVGAGGMFPLRTYRDSTSRDSSPVWISAAPLAVPPPGEPVLSVFAIAGAVLLMILSVTSLTLLYRRLADRVMLARAIQRWLRAKRTAKRPVWVPTDGLVQWGPMLVALRFMLLAPRVRDPTEPARTAVRDPSFGYQVVLQFQRLMYFGFLFVGLIGLTVPVWFMVRESPLQYGFLLPFAAALLGGLHALAGTLWLVWRRWSWLFTPPPRWTERWYVIRPKPRRAPQYLGWPMPSWATRWGEVFGRLLVMALVTAYLGLLTYFVLSHFLDDSFEAILFDHRALAISSGLSPLLPLTLGAAWFVAWCLWHLKRVEYLQQTTAFEQAVQYAESVALPPLIVRVAPAVIGLRRQLLQLIPSGRELATVLVILGVGAFILYESPLRTLESVASAGKPFGWFLGLAIGGAMVATALSAFRFLIVWRDLRNVLLRISTTPLVWAFDRLPVRISRLVHLTLTERSSEATVAAVLSLQWQHLRRIYSENATSFAPLLGGDATFGWLFPIPGQHSRRAVRRGIAFQRLYAVLDESWRLEPRSDEVGPAATEVARPGAGTPPNALNTAATLRRTFPGTLGLWLREAEELAATEVVAYIEWVMRTLRRLALFLLASLLLTTALVSSYPFRPQSGVKGMFLIEALAVIGIVLFVLVQMNQEEVLSRIHQTDPGHVNWDRGFVINIALLVLLPLLSLLSSASPEVGDALFGWVDPVLRAISKG